MSTRARKRVLVVDDSPLMRRLITEIVEADPDFSVVDVAENGRVALEKVREHHPDCVLLDVEMPELSGLDTMRRLRLRSAAKIIILSHLGHEGTRVRAEALRLGAVAVIDKPTGAISRDLQTTRGSIIQQTLRRVLGLPALDMPDEPLPLDGASAIASILGIHVRGFASLSERIATAELVDLFNEHLELVENVTTTHNGVIDGHTSAMSLAAFGVPQRAPDHASRAVSAAQELLSILDARRADAREGSAPIFDLGLAVITGLVVAGALGSLGAQSYRTIGSTIDFASRLARASEGYGAELIVCGRTLSALNSPPPSRRLDIVQLESDSEPIILYEVLSPRAETDTEAIDAYARGMEHYEAGEIAKAVKAFEDAIKRRPTDRAAARLLARCRTLLRAPATTWSGIWSLDGGGS